MSGAEIVHRGEVRVVLAEPPLEPPPELRDRVDELWERERLARPELVDGTMISVSDIEGDRVLTRACSYRLFLARERDAALRVTLGVRALGVSGILLVGGNGSAPAVVLGRRAAGMTEYAGAWELVPSGGVEPRRADANGIVDVTGALLDELEEEAGVPSEAVVETVPLGLVHDLGQDGYDVCFALRLRDAPPALLSEYEETALVSARDVAAWLDAAERAVVPTSPMILELARAAALL
jgi:8-oxo-dGTP pyrophosphatase MutT (NUDIX family)